MARTVVALGVLVWAAHVATAAVAGNIKFTTKELPGQAVVMTAQVSGNPPAAPEVAPDMAPPLQLTKALSTHTAAPGDLVTYTFTVTNLGTVLAQNILISDSEISNAIADGRLTFETANLSAVSPSLSVVIVIIGLKGQGVQIFADAIDASGPFGVSLTFRFNGGAPVVNQAMVQADCPEPETDPPTFDPCGAEVLATSDDPDTPKANDPTILVQAAPAPALQPMALGGLAVALLLAGIVVRRRVLRQERP